MKKIISVLLILLLWYNNTYSQHIIISYNIETNSSFEVIEEDIEGIDREESKKITKSFNESFELINSMKAHLIASKNESYYWIENSMPSDVNVSNYEMAKIMIGYDNSYYTNYQSGIYTKYFSAYGEKFKMETLINSFNWKLSKETKTIGNLKCFKAVTTYKVVNKLREHTVEAVAWYAPSLQYNFGPKGFSGLPGLIIELKDDKVTYKVDNLEFKESKLQAKKIPKGKLVTQAELDEHGEKVRQNFINNRN